MNTSKALSQIKKAVESSPRNGYVAELHVQCLKYSSQLETVTGKEFCEALEIGQSFGTEFAKMRKIADRLKGAGLNVELL